MKKLITIFILLISFNLSAQQKFTNIYCDQSQTNEVYNAIELNNHYYFLVFRYQQLTNYTNIVYKTDATGNILDSILLAPFMTDTSVYFTDLYVNNGKIELYGMGNPLDINTSTFHKPILLRYKINENLLVVDSFKIPTNDTNHYKAMTNITKIDGKVFYNALYSSYPFRTYTHVSDTIGNYLLTKQIIPYSYLNNISGSDTNRYFINAFLNNHPKVVMLSNSLDTVRTFDLNTLVQAVPTSMSISQKNDTSIYVGYGKEYQPGSFKQVLGLCILDTNGNVLHDVSLPYDSVFDTGSLIFVRNTFSTQYTNNLYIGSNRRFTPDLIGNSYFQIANLDSNLNIRWSKIFGGEMPYMIWSYYATSDSGCLLMGKRKNAQLGNIIEPIVFKISNTGAITSVVSFNKNIDEQIIFYPNPAKEFITVLATQYFHQSQCSIFSVSGTLLQSAIIHNGENRIDISSLALGNYFYTIKNKKGESTSGQFTKK